MFSTQQTAQGDHLLPPTFAPHGVDADSQLIFPSQEFSDTHDPLHSQSPHSSGHATPHHHQLEGWPYYSDGQEAYSDGTEPYSSDGQAGFPSAYGGPSYTQISQQAEGPDGEDLTPRDTVAGSLDPSTGIFYRTPQHPRLRTAQACEKCRVRKAKV